MKSKKILTRTHITVILDRTGSMSCIKDDIIGGFNSFLADQKKVKAAITLTLMQFDSQEPYEFIYKMKPIKEVLALTSDTYQPRGATPLLDAMGKAINELEGKISNMEDEAKPNKVVVVVITDGQENASQEYRKEQIEKLIKDRTAANWQFVFLSADLASIGDAHSYGFSGANTMGYDHTSKGTSNAFLSLSANVTSYASGVTRCMCFNDIDRAKQDIEKKVAKKTTTVK